MVYTYIRVILKWEVSRLSGMKKGALNGLMQYIGAIVLLLCTALLIYGYGIGALPFMDDDYLAARKEAEKEAATSSVPDDTSSSQPEVQITAASFTAELERIGAGIYPYKGIYGDNTRILLRSLSGLSLGDDEKITLCMGYIIVSKNGSTVAVYDGAFNDVSNVLNGYGLTLKRDASGNALFYGDDGYVYLENGALVKAEYDAVNFDKGVNREYPSYLAGCDTAYTVFEENGLYGLRRNADGVVIVPAKYADVYGVSEGISIAVGGDNRLYMYNTDGVLISDGYYAAEGGADDVGYFFVRNGLTRARSANGEELLLRADGSVMGIPSGFTVVAYSDGVILLKGKNGYGYMQYNGKWLCTPQYSAAEPFNEGLAVVCDDSGLYGALDLNGDVVIPCVFESLTDFSDGVAVAYTQKLGYFVLNKAEE